MLSEKTYLCLKTIDVIRWVRLELDEFIEICDDNPIIYTLRDESERFILHWAALSGTPEIVTYTLAKNPTHLHERDVLGVTPIILAGQRGDIEVATILLKAGANINDQNDNGHSAFEYACSRGKYQMVNFLMLQGADLNIQDKRGDTGLHRASSLGHVDVLSVLLSHSTPPNLDIQNNTGCTPLHFAFQDHQFKCAIELIKSGARIDVQDMYEKTPLDYCEPRLRMEMIAKQPIKKPDSEVTEDTSEKSAES